MGKIEIVKDAFFFLGSLAGIISLSRSILEGRYTSDKNKLEKILSEVSEENMVNLYNGIWQSQRVFFKPLDALYRLDNDIDNNFESVRFHGPLKTYIETELKGITTNIDNLREQIQVPYWNPKETGDNGYREINKEWFYDHQEDYVLNMDRAKLFTQKIRDHIRKLQVIKDIHFLECYIPFLNLDKRIANITLTD